MKKKITIIVISILVIILAGLAYYCINKKRTLSQNNDMINRPVDIMTDAEKDSLNLYHSGIYEVIFRDANNVPTQYRFIGLKEPEEISLELMSEAEKEELKIPVDMKIQVLSRDSQGKIASYHIIKNDSDIVKKY